MAARVADQADDRGLLGRPRNQVALHRDFAAGREEVELGGPLDALDRHVQAEVAAQADHRVHDRGRARVAVDPCDHAAIELDPAEGQLLDGGQRRESSAEIVEHGVHVEHAQAVQRIDGHDARLQHRFRQLEFDRVGRQAVPGEQAFDVERGNCRSRTAGPRR